MTDLKRNRLSETLELLAIVLLGAVLLGWFRS
jgi:hypothetical protein